MYRLPGIESTSSSGPSVLMVELGILKSVPDEIDVPPYVLRENGTVLDLIIKQLKPQQYRIFHIDLVSPAFTARFASN